MPRRPPLRSQGPQFVDEDASPPTSLLLSTSDCTSSERMPETRQFSRPTKYPCRHFSRTGGWCPAGAQCRFYHDVAVLPSAGVPKAEHAPPFATGAYGEQRRTISGGVLMGRQLSSPSTVAHGHSQPQYSEDRPMYWPNYTWQPYQPYYATAPTTAVVPIPATAALSSAVQPSIYPLPQPRAETVLPSDAGTSLPSGAYEVNGTTYFPPPMPSVPAPASVTYSIPVHPAPYNHAVVPAYPYYAPPNLSASHYGSVPHQMTDVRPQTSFNPFTSDPMTTSQLPVVPRLEDYQMSPIQHDILPLPLTSSTNDRLLTKDEEPDFPYHPPENQRVGHARRISVNIKKLGRANSRP